MLGVILTLLTLVVTTTFSNYDNRKQRELTERGQITDRFSTAVDQLGHKERNVRLGGIYALERIMRDSESDQPAIVESSSRLSATEHLSPAATTMITQQPTCRRR
jgi:hypothetical protein